MPEIKYCRDCKKLFQYVTGPVLCHVCRKRDEEEFEKVRKFLGNIRAQICRKYQTVQG